MRRLALALPGTTEDELHGEYRAWIVNKRGFVWERPLRKSDLAALGSKAPKGPILGARVESLEMKDAVLASNPKVFFTTPHFDGYPAVLIRLDKIGVKALAEIVEAAWLARAGKRAVAEFCEGLRGRR